MSRSWWILASKTCDPSAWTSFLPWQTLFRKGGRAKAVGFRARRRYPPRARRLIKAADRASRASIGDLRYLPGCCCSVARTRGKAPQKALEVSGESACSMEYITSLPVYVLLYTTQQRYTCFIRTSVMARSREASQNSASGPSSDDLLGMVDCRRCRRCERRDSDTHKLGVIFARPPACPTQARY